MFTCQRQKRSIADIFSCILQKICYNEVDNYFIAYPIYMNFMPIEAIIGMYQEIRPGTDGLLECLTVFNMPYTFAKGILDAIICFLIYTPLSPIFHGKNKTAK